jgi:hypothetical protein
MPKVLIVSPRFPPKNAADLHRVRMSLPYYRYFGWEPTVLCLTHNSSDGVDDPDLAKCLPADVEVVRVNAWSERKCRRLGFGHLDYRSLVPLYRAGRELLKKHDYDVVFFSTTAFLTFLLGPIWKRRFGCKIVYDFQDPWRQDGEFPYTRKTVPGKWWKYRLGQMLARHLEPIALKSADHIISVSPGYVANLSRYYPWLSAAKFTVIPFGAEKADFDFVRDQDIKHNLFHADRGITRWVSVGRAGPDMDPILSVFFRELAALKNNDLALASSLKVYFVGTNYSPAERTFKVVEALACRHGLGDMVEEHSKRIPYYEALSLYRESDGVLLFGTNSADYTASKLFNCVLSGKPVLALFHEKSLVSVIGSRFSNVFLGQFKSTSEEVSFTKAVANGVQWLWDHKCNSEKMMFDETKIDQELKPWSAIELTRVQCSIFDHVCVH